MKYSFDTDLCRKKKTAPGLFLYLASLYFTDREKEDVAEWFREANEKGYVEFDHIDLRNRIEGLRLSPYGMRKVEEIITESNRGNPKDTKNRYHQLAGKMQKIFPAGRKEGTVYMWRDSVAVIARRMMLFMENFGEFTDKVILEATRRYVESFHKDYQYMQILKYFIFKQKEENGIISLQSNLLNWIENEDQEENGWESQLR